MGPHGLGGQYAFLQGLFACHARLALLRCETASGYAAINRRYL